MPICSKLNPFAQNMQKKLPAGLSCKCQYQSTVAIVSHKPQLVKFIQRKLNQQSRFSCAIRKPCHQDMDTPKHPVECSSTHTSGPTQQTNPELPPSMQLLQKLKLDVQYLSRASRWMPCSSSSSPPVLPLQVQPLTAQAPLRQPPPLLLLPPQH